MCLCEPRPIGITGWGECFGYTDPLGLSCSTDSNKLGKALGKGPDDHNAHHIVMSNSKDPRMVELRNQMDTHNIKINSEENGVWLPKNESVRIDNSTLHYGEGVHGDAYKQHVYDTLNGKSKSDFLDGLNSIKNDLMNGKVFPKK